MVYKKYIEKNGKIYGPYIYHSKRVNGKVISEYRGSGNKKLSKKFLWIFIIFAGLILLLGLFIFLSKTNFIGRVILGIESSYTEGQPVQGVLRLSLKRGELLPANSKVILTNGNNTNKYLLSDLVGEEPIEGNFYVEGKSLMGVGKGYGVEGTKPIYQYQRLTKNLQN